MKDNKVNVSEKLSVILLVHIKKNFLLSFRSYLFYHVCIELLRCRRCFQSIILRGVRDCILDTVYGV